MVNNSIQRQKIFNAVQFGIEVEFFTHFPIKKVASELSKVLNKKIIVPKLHIGLNKDTKIRHSPDEVSANVFKIESDYSGGKSMLELVTGVVYLPEGRILLIKILEWIRKNGWTTDKCGLHINISFDTKKIDIRSGINAIDKLKFVLNFDEDMIYRIFPKRKNSTYARSIKTLYPISKFVFADNVEMISRENYITPSGKYFGVNFGKIAQNYLEFRYLGGAGYERKVNGILEIIEYLSLFCYETIQNPSYSKQELNTLNKLLGDYRKVISSFSDVESFLYNYKNLQLLVDLSGNIEMLKTYYPRIREKLFELIVENGLKKGIVNFDTDLSKYQLKDARLTKAYELDDLEIFDSKLSGIISKCDLYNCEITNSHILDCRLIQSNTIKSSKVTNTPIHIGNEIYDSFINNGINIINCIVEGGVIVSGEIGMLAQIATDVEIIDDNRKDVYRKKGKKDEPMQYHDKITKK